MKQELTKEEILFIDNYLKNSGVEFIDVRVEMIDHVASEIENRLEENSTSSFYDEFKLYMIQHKKSLLKNIGKYRWSLDKRILKQVFKNLLHQKVLAITGLFLLIGFSLLNTLSVTAESLMKNYFYISIVILIISVIYPIFWLRKQKISVINRAAVLCYILNFYVFQYLFKWIDSSFLILVLLTLLYIWANVSFAFTQVKYVKFYKDKFQLS